MVPTAIGVEHGEQLINALTVEIGKPKLRQHVVHELVLRERAVAVGVELHEGLHHLGGGFLVDALRLWLWWRQARSL